MAEALDNAGLLALLDAGELVLLPSAPAASALRNRFDQAQRARGSRVWEPPAVSAWNEWTESLWRRLILEGLEDRILLNRLQEESLWVEIVTDSAEGAHLTHAGARELATLSRSALGVVGAHDVLARVRTSADTPDAKAFAGWLNTFLDRCQAGRFLPRALLELGLMEHLHARALPSPPTVHLAGFDRLTPAQNAFLDALRSAGCTTSLHELVYPHSVTPIRGSVLAADPREELLWAVRWIRERYQQTPDPLFSTALVVPDPAVERTSLEPLLREVLAPELGAVGTDLSSTPWHFGSGPALASLQIIQHALLLLRWAFTELPVERIGALLLSPFLTHTESFEARARFEMHGLRRATLLRPELSLARLLALAGRERHGAAPLSFPELAAFGQLTGDPRAPSGRGSHADWIEFVRKLLRSTGWPGPRTLTAEEYNATEAWESVLDLLATLDVTSRRVTFAEVIAQLERETLSTPAPEAGPDAPVQIVRWHETEGRLFGNVVILRATDTELPEAEHAHPLLAWGLQRSLHLPATDPAVALARSREALKSLSRRCGDLLLVSSAADETGPLRVSPLGEQLGFVSLDPANLVPRAAELIPLKPESTSDTTPLPPLPSSRVSGGARLLELQAACGFRAFAELRLGAATPESQALGLNARESGSVLHSALEFFWSEVQTQQTLKGYSPEERSQALQRSVAHAFAPLRRRVATDDVWTGAYLGILEQRLRSLLNRWLDRELERSPFTVLPPEQKQVVTVGPLELSIRPDRIDRVDGGFVLIDYKTSSALSTEDWLGERPDAPQLPLYALLGDGDEFRGLAFARVRPGKDMAWLSLEDQPGIFPEKRGGALHDIAGQIELWRTELERLAEDFATGRSYVNPKAYPHTCQYCQQRLLCRLDAASMLANADGPAPGDAEAHSG